MALRVKLSAFLLAAALATAGFSQRCHAQASITLSRKIGPPTSTSLVAGTGFQPNIGVDIYFDKQDVGLAVTNDQGQFPQTQVSVPKAAGPGRHLISAIGRNNGGTAQGRFIVNTDWSQMGFDPAQTNWNPYENVLNPGNVYRLNLLWYSEFGTYGYGPEHAPPTTYQGKVYASWVGGGADYLYALSELNGFEDWTFVGTGSSAAISHGVAYSASENYLAAVNAANGTLLWKFPFRDDDYPPSPPVVADGKVLFGTRSGSVYALDQSTGNPLWHVQIQGIVTSAPATLNKNIYACGSSCYAYSSNGSRLWEFAGSGGATPAASSSMVILNSYQATTALDPTSGTVLWQHALSGSNTAVALAKGVVFVTGTSDVFALSAITGKSLWHAPIVSSFSPAVANGVVYVSGDSSGFLYALDAASGTILWQYSVGDLLFIISSPSVVNGRVYLTTIDAIGGEAILYAFGLK